MLNKNFGIEIEFTGITRSHAAKILSQNLGNRTVRSLSDSFDTRIVIDEKARKWKIMSDGSLKNEKKINGMKVEASSQYSVELVSPILNYHDDIETLQTLIREFRKAGAFTNETCGIHIHLDGTDHNVKSVKNFIKIIASKNDLFYEALKIKPQRRRYCQKMDEKLVKAIKLKRPKTLQKLEEIWYEGYAGYRQNHYHNSRYHFLNLHSFFHGNKTIEDTSYTSRIRQLTL